MALGDFNAVTEFNNLISRLNRIGIVGSVANTWANSLDPTVVRHISDADLAAVVAGQVPSAWDGWGPRGSRTSARDFRFYLPAAATDDTLETFNMPADLPSGALTLCVRVDDPSGYFPPLPLAITGRASDGAYLIGTVTVP